MQNSGIYLLMDVPKSLRYATISDQSFKPAGRHHQSQGEPLEPLPRLETAQPDGFGEPDPAAVGNHDR